MSRLDSARYINAALLALSVGLGTFALYVHNNLLPYIYLIFGLGVMVAHIYLYCTRCVYYGKECYIFGGLLAKRFFKGRHEGPMDPDDALIASLWFMLAMFPVPFLLYYQDLLLAGVYVLFFWGWFLAHSRTACLICDNTWCTLNQKKGRK